VRYLAAGGRCAVFDIDAHLQGVLGLDRFERDTLAYVLNERLDELAQASHVPYLRAVEDRVANLQEVIAELLDEGPGPASRT
jgi:hypothetical protein